MSQCGLIGGILYFKLAKRFVLSQTGPMCPIFFTRLFIHTDDLNMMVAASGGKALEIDELLSLLSMDDCHHGRRIVIMVVEEDNTHTMPELQSKLLAHLHGLLIGL